MGAIVRAALEDLSRFHRGKHIHGVQIQPVLLVGGDSQRGHYTLRGGPMLDQFPHRRPLQTGGCGDRTDPVTNDQTGELPPDVPQGAQGVRACVMISEVHGFLQKWTGSYAKTMSA
jgi:hypothetical protein